MLLTEQNTPKVDRMIHRAVQDAIADRDLPKGTYGTFFEHGQWWIQEKRSGAQYSVCDAEPGQFCFEQVTVGEEL